ncbi:MAG TPA: adenylate/guanylate cyclase domain-containing protein [Candidatus Acidoferrum sp.]|jgi:adenylate cyclase
MPTPPEGGRQQRSVFRIRDLFASWWDHRASFLISVGITLAALALYFFTFLGERPTPIFNFLQRLELDALDMRFTYRPANATPHDPRIVIVDIDQHSQEVLGRWPFARSNFAKMLDVLKQDDAKTVAFDITFSKPDQSGAAIRELWSELEAKKKRGEPVDAKLEEQVKELVAKFDADKQFGAAIKRFGAVVLGSYFLYTDADMRGMDDATLDKYAEQLSFFSFPQIRPLDPRPEIGQRDRLNLIREFANESTSLIPQGAEANIPELADSLGGNASSTGFFNAPPDEDGVVRRATMVLPYGRSKDLKDWDLYGSLDVMATSSYLRLGANELILQYGEPGVAVIEFGPNLRIIPNNVGMKTINYRGPAGTFPHYSMADVVEGKFAPGTFKDKLVLVGATATGIGDLKTTPYGGTNYPGVEIHANVIDNILNQRFMRRGQRQFETDVLLIFLFGIPLGIALALVSPRFMWFGLALLIPFATLNFYAFNRGWWLNFILPAGTLTANVLLVSLYRALVEEKEKRKVRSAFGQYLSPEVIRRLLLNPKLVDPRKTEITVMFSDIRGFTTISERLDAQELALFLNSYLSDMTKIVFDTHGTLDKYIGDAVMAFWGAPYEEATHASDACIAALNMMSRVHELQKVWESEGKPKLDIGVGLNSGVASVGNMGSSLRYGYTALGDTVNLSSRLEGLNKDYGTHILANESTFQAAKDGGFLFREIDVIRVKGKMQGVTIYELYGRFSELQKNGSMPDVQERFQQFADARALYSRRKWSEAQAAFQAILDRWPDEGPSRTYWKRCQEYLFDEPPSTWDGVFTMTHK